VGGAERAERQRRQQALRGQQARRGQQGQQAQRSQPNQQGQRRPKTRPAKPPLLGGGDRRGLIIGIAIVAVIALAVVGGVLWQRNRSAPDPTPATQAAADYPVALSDGIVVAGEADAPLTVDVYEDFLCPACGTFERRDGGAIDDALSEGKIKVRYHVVNILDGLSNPAGYSTNAGNAALCAAEAGQFPDYHASLFANQPREGARGYSDDQLVKLGRDVGITTPDFESCVPNGTHEATIHSATDAASADESLQRTYSDGRRSFATPTVVIDGQIVELGGSSAWLTDAISAAAP